MFVCLQLYFSRSALPAANFPADRSFSFRNAECPRNPVIVSQQCNRLECALVPLSGLLKNRFAKRDHQNTKRHRLFIAACLVLLPPIQRYKTSKHCSFNHQFTTPSSARGFFGARYSSSYTHTTVHLTTIVFKH